MTQPSMHDILHAARGREGGVICYFENADYPSPEACKKALVKYRNSFYTFRTKAKRDQRRRFGNDDETLYDNLSCSVDETPTGWRVTISKTVYEGEKFFDVNGEPIDWRKEGVA